MTETQTIDTPKLPRTATITLRATDGSVLQLVAERLAAGAKTYALTVDKEKKSSRGMTATHPTFEAARTAIALSASEAQKLGWLLRVAARHFVAKPDAFSKLPAAPKGKKVAK